MALVSWWDWCAAAEQSVLKADVLKAGKMCMDLSNKGQTVMARALGQNVYKMVGLVECSQSAVVST